MIDAVVKANRTYASLPGVPHKDIDKKAAGLQERSEVMDRVRLEMAGDAVFGAVELGIGGLGSMAAKFGLKKLEKFAGCLAAGAVAAKAGAAFHQGIDRRIAAAFDKANIDAGDEKAVRGFIEKNPKLVEKATRRALWDAATIVLSPVGGQKFAKHFSKDEMIADEFAQKIIGGTIKGGQKLLEPEN